MKHSSIKKILVVAFSFAIAFTMATSAYATPTGWVSFQNTNANDGVITDEPFIEQQSGPDNILSTGPHLRTINLSSSGSGWSGVDNVSVMKGGYSYVLYNGRDNGGRIAKINLTNGQEVWNKQACVDNTFQLSSPAMRGNELYFLTQGMAALWTMPAFNGILAPNGNNNKHQLLHFGPNTSHRLHVEAKAGDGSSIKLKVTVRREGGQEVNLNLDNNSSIEADPNYQGLQIGTDTTILNKNFSTVFAEGGRYFIFLKFHNSGASPVNLEIGVREGLSNTMQLKRINNVMNADPSVDPIISFSAGGQCNTPITISGNYAYFGRWTSEGGAGSYYQVKLTSAQNRLKEINTDRGYYWAGATAHDGKVYFGCDDGYLRWASESDFDNINGCITTAQTHGAIRSSIVKYVKNGIAELYYTSKDGYLWKYMPSTNTLSSMRILSSGTTSCTSTPVISEKGVLYVGYGGFSGTSKGVRCIKLSDFGNESKWKDVAFGTNFMVQSSPIVYSKNSTNYDYVFFTTNVGSGTGYCYRVAISENDLTSTCMWKVDTTLGSTYTLQGMSSDRGYLVYGNDDNKYYIIK